MTLVVVVVNDAKGFGVLVPNFFLLTFLVPDDGPVCFRPPMLTRRFSAGKPVVVALTAVIFLFVPVLPPTREVVGAATLVVVITILGAGGAGVIFCVVSTRSGERLVEETTGGRTSEEDVVVVVSTFPLTMAGSVLKSSAAHLYRSLKDVEGRKAPKPSSSFFSPSTSSVCPNNEGSSVSRKEKGWLD